MSTFLQLRAPKEEQNTPMESKKLKDWILTCWSEWEYEK